MRWLGCLGPAGVLFNLQLNHVEAGMGRGEAGVGLSRWATTSKKS